MCWRGFRFHSQSILRQEPLNFLGFYLLTALWGDLLVRTLLFCWLKIIQNFSPKIERKENSLDQILLSSVSVQEKPISFLSLSLMLEAERTYGHLQFVSNLYVIFLVVIHCRRCLKQVDKWFGTLGRSNI